VRPASSEPDGDMALPKSESSREGRVKLEIASISSASLLSGTFLWTAAYGAQRCQDIEDEATRASGWRTEHICYVITAITSFAAFLEALVNEVYWEVRRANLKVGHCHPQFPNVTSKSQSYLLAKWDDRAKILDKYDVILACAGLQTFEKGRLPYQNASMLVDLRNKLVHYRPEMQLHEGDPGTFTRKLQNKFPECAAHFGSDNPWWPDKALGAGCAKWAHDSARALADEWNRRLRAPAVPQVEG